LPSVSALLENARVRALIARHSRPLTIEAIHGALEWYRGDLKPGDAAPSLDKTVDTVEVFLNRAEAERLRPVVNATGIILHTGLGRAVLPQRAVDALAGLNRCCNLQIDLETGLRGKRNYRTEQLLCRLTGADAAVIVNNNAAATLLILAALCKDKEVVVSRGQLIEIGGSFRLPDCVHQSGAILVEVGTTNKTHLDDYERAVNENTGAVMRVNPSNYRVVGFIEEVPVADLVSLKKQHPGLLVIDDLGCGAMIDLSQYGLPREPTVQESLAAGADVVCFSGDKLIGGPQAGIIVGRKDLVQKIRKHPFTRMLRVGKMTDMALEQTLRLFLDPETLTKTHPTLRMLTMPAQTLKQKAMRLKRRLAREHPAAMVRVEAGESATGGGALPATPIPTYVLAVSIPGASADRMLDRLRRHEPPVIARIREDTVLLDMRTLLPGEDDVVFQALNRLFTESAREEPGEQQGAP
jgi:L-seryl-tRNA(Ser) seleniumtransferase